MANQDFPLARLLLFSHPLIIAMKSWAEMSCALSVLEISQQETTKPNGSNGCGILNLERPNDQVCVCVEVKDNLQHWTFMKF